MAKLAAVFANEGQLDSIHMISKQTVIRALKPLPWMPDAVVSRNVTFAQGGFGVGLKFPGSDLEWYSSSTCNSNRIGMAGVVLEVLWYFSIQKHVFHFHML